MVTELVIATRSLVLDGKPFGQRNEARGQGVAYEKLAGTMRFAVDPDDECNARVTDIGLAPRNAHGQVEFAADFYLLKPVEARKGNGRLLLDCVNRGRKVVLGMLNSAPRVPDPATEAEFGNGFLMRHGYTLAWVGWQIDVPRRDGLMALDAPRAQGVVGELRCQMQPNKRVQILPLADRYHIPNPTVDLDDPTARLRVKVYAGAEPVEVARTAWRFSDPGHIELSEGFIPGAIYEVIYRSANPPIAGLGFLAIRDCAGYLRWGRAGNPCAEAIERSYLFGVSQTGRFLRQMLHLGLDQDEQGRAVFDAVIPHIAGGRRGEFNLRFGQPSLNGKDAVGELPPFNAADLFARLGARTKAPRIFLTNSSAEYWRGDASLTHTDIEGSRDLEPPEFVRIYALAGTQHTPGALPPLEADPNTGDRGLQRFNVVDYAPLMRAALVNLDRWVSSETAPPASAFPRLADGSAVQAEDLASFFGTLPGVRFPETIVRPRRLDFGPDIERGIAAYPPRTGAPYRSYVSKIDADGNELAGIRPPELAVPLATYCGWNPRHPDTGAAGELMQMMGSTLPFALTRAQRGRSGDPRASIEERHTSKDAYLARVHAAAMALAGARHVLAEDVDAIVERASRLWDYLHA